jgi:hypothetical protein
LLDIQRDILISPDSYVAQLGLSDGKDTICIHTVRTEPYGEKMRLRDVGAMSKSGDLPKKMGSVTGVIVSQSADIPRPQEVTETLIKPDVGAMVVYEVVSKTNYLRLRYTEQSLLNNFAHLASVHEWFKATVAQKKDIIGPCFDFEKDVEKKGNSPELCQNKTNFIMGILNQFYVDTFLLPLMEQIFPERVTAGLKINYVEKDECTGGQAIYNPAEDSITLTEAFYRGSFIRQAKVLAHELGHRYYYLENSIIRDTILESLLYSFSKEGYKRGEPVNCGKMAAYLAFAEGVESLRECGKISELFAQAFEDEFIFKFVSLGILNEMYESAVVLFEMTDNARAVPPEFIAMPLVNLLDSATSCLSLSDGPVLGVLKGIKMIYGLEGEASDMLLFRVNELALDRIVIDLMYSLELQGAQL